MKIETLSKFGTMFIHIPTIDIKSARKSLLKYPDWRNYKIESIFSHGNQRLIENGEVVFGYYESYPELILTRK